MFGKNRAARQGKGLILFEEVADVFKTEKRLGKEGYNVTPIAPPVEYRKGCDLVLEFGLALQLGVERNLKGNGLPYTDMVAIDEDSREPVKLVQATDFGDYRMVKSGNMKLSFDKKNGEIVNVSGGGCPDVPYLHACLVGRNLKDAPSPKDLGYTLCALMLDRAFEEALSFCRENPCT